MAQLSAKIDALDPAELDRTRAQALRGLKTAEGERREHWAAILVLTDQRREHDDFESRLADARRALGRTPSREEEQIKREAQQVRKSMTADDKPDAVTRRARTVRASMEKARPAARSSSSGSFEDRLAAAKAAIGRS